MQKWKVEQAQIGFEQQIWTKESEEEAPIAVDTTCWKAKHFKSAGVRFKLGKIQQDDKYKRACS